MARKHLSVSKVSSENIEGGLDPVEKHNILKYLRDFLKVHMSKELPKAYIDKLIFYYHLADCLACILFVVHSEACTSDQIKKLLKNDLKKST